MPDEYTGFRLSASIVLWRGGEILVMKRAGGFSAGGWFIPGGHVEQGERPGEAAARELQEETGIEIDAADLRLVDVMTYETEPGTTAHTIIYNGDCADGVECAINEEHVYSRWMTPDAYIARFLDGDYLRSRGIPAPAIALAEEVARVVRSATAARASTTTAP